MKRNQSELRKLMGSHDVGAREVADLLKKKPDTINQYRCRSGRAISDADLCYLRQLLEENYPITGN